MSGHFLARKQQERGPNAAGCGDVAGGNRGHGGGRCWFQTIDHGEGKLSGWLIGFYKANSSKVLVSAKPDKGKHGLKM